MKEFNIGKGNPNDMPPILINTDIDGIISGIKDYVTKVVGNKRISDDFDIPEVTNGGGKIFNVSGEYNDIATMSGLNSFNRDIDNETEGRISDNFDIPEATNGGGKISKVN